MASQTERLILLLRVRGEKGVTPLDALDHIGSFRLAARISDAKRLIPDDEEIVTERATNGDTSFARYVLRRRVTPGYQSPTLWD